MLPFLFFIVTACVLIITELVVFNLSIFWLLFIGLGALITALASWIIPDISWLSAVSIFIIATMLVSTFLYLPLKRWQTNPKGIKGNNVLGQTAKVITPIEANGEGKAIWSGTTWQAKLSADSKPLNEGDIATIVAVEGIVITLKNNS
ncbi:NfeD family protein [Reinekea thalattae]|uniref:NfeD family protein n=1 Tax=Reinekea thalattae TaxID=2593301 RepID=A0A5C8ZD72_9GAMM|nr:NfeD family protein [Reinekea thalattae]TXR54866.1 NfeD family protein [Reinekea thalattae]